MKFIRSIAALYSNLYLSNRLFMVLGAVIFLFLLAFPFPFLFPVAQTVLVVVVVAFVADIMLLFNKRIKVTGNRKVSRLLSLGDENPVVLTLENRSPVKLWLTVIDELPFQLQLRTFSRKIELPAGNAFEDNYSILPVQRGAYQFGNVNTYIRSFLGLAERRITHELQTEVATYPSLIQMKKFELKTFARIASDQGIKKTRRIGHSYEFEQIKNYVTGDDYRSINWKATGRRGGDLMVNQYEDERAQQIYCVIDKSRSMKMPFGGLSLLDYSINSSLVISNIALLKHDKAGLLTFSDKIGTLIKADRGNLQLQRIMEGLYKQKERTLEANYELLYTGMRSMIKGRSLLFLFTNFESIYALERVMPLLRRINRLHLLVVVFFENTELTEYGYSVSKNMEEMYHQTIAQRFVMEKRQIIQELARYGIQSILTKPDELSMNTVNKYLELKSRGLI
jgi:uncharacterized protein (DUF58 family)